MQDVYFSSFFSIMSVIPTISVLSSIFKNAGTVTDGQKINFLGLSYD